MSKAACMHQPVIAPDPQSPNHELVTCSACGLSRRRAKDTPIFEQQGAAIATDGAGASQVAPGNENAPEAVSIENSPLNGSGG